MCFPGFIPAQSACNTSILQTRALNRVPVTGPDLGPRGGYPFEEIMYEPYLMPGRYPGCVENSGHPAAMNPEEKNGTCGTRPLIEISNHEPGLYTAPFRGVAK